MRTMVKMKWSEYNYMYNSAKHGALLFNLQSGAFLDISDPEIRTRILHIQDNPDSVFAEDNAFCDALLSAGIVCESDEENRTMMNFTLLSSRFNPQVRNLTIMPTLDCNLACCYCFEAANRKEGKMSAFVVEQLKRYIKEQYGDFHGYVRLGWFGGEPLLGFDVMEDITEYMKNENIHFDASIITNGVLLTQDKIDKLCDLRINSVQITLDGPKDVHDEKRRFKNGRGTYDIITSNMDKLHEYVVKHSNICVDIRINVDRENRMYYHVLYDLIRRRYPQFHVYPGIITQYQSCGMTLPCFANAREEAEFYIEQYEQYGIVHPEFNISAKGMRNCMAECVYTDLVGPKGELYLCLQDVGNKDMQVGSIFTGKTNMRLMSAYCSGKLTFDSDECRKCPVQTFCGGGCVNKRYRTLKYGEPHYYCAAYKDHDLLEKYLDIYYETVKQK